MREKNYPIVWDPDEETYRFNKKVYLVEPKVFCGRDELISVVLASSMMEHFRFAQLSAPMNNLKSFLLNDTRDGPQQHQKWQEKFSYVPAPPPSSMKRPGRRWSTRW